MSSVVLSDIFKSYKKWVSNNPTKVGDYEQTAKWVSYFAAGRISNSSILSELVFTLSNLLVLFNDTIISSRRSNAQGGLKIDHHQEYKLKLSLTTLEYCEVFIELTAKKILGEKGRFLVIFIIQTIKCIARLALMLKHKNAITTTPMLPPLNRKDDEPLSMDSINAGNAFCDTKSITFSLKRSGKIIRKVANAPPMFSRNFKPLHMNEEVPSSSSFIKVNSKLMTKAEIFYVMKPMIHLGSVGLFGYSSWKSWITSLMLDMMSLNMYYKNRHLLSKEQKRELSRRCVAILFYVMKSPFYDRYSQDKINALLSVFAKNIPFTKAVIEPLLQYIPHWQSTYFYMWST